MKKLLLTSVAVIGTVCCVGLTKVAAHEDSFDVLIYAITGPVKTDPGYQAWATPTVWQMHTNGLDSLDIGHQLLTTNIAQPADLSNTNTLWFAVKVISKDPSVMFSLNELAFVEKSSDVSSQYPLGSLANTYVLSTITNLVYNPRAIGIIWSSAGPGVSDTIVDDALTSGNTLVNEIDFIGMQSAYYDYSPSYPYSSVDAYVQGFPNFLLTASCSVIDTNGVVWATGQKTLQAKGNVFVPILTDIYNASPQQISVGANMETNTTIRVYHSSTLQPPIWSLTATMNAGDLLVRTNDNLGFFRAILE